MAKKLPAGDAPIKARVLTRHHIDGNWHPADALISAPVSAIKDLESQGVVDSDEDAVAYAESLV